jgi:exopolysaccharide biosynthesis polyprenyl glycosylphosphotransferase
VFLYRHGRERRHLLLVGADATAQHVAQRIHHHPALGYHLVGYCSDEEDLIESAPARRVGPIDGIARAVEEYQVETIIVCLPQGKDDMLHRIIGELEGKNVQLLLQPEVIGVVPTRLRVQEMFGIPFLGIKDIPMTTWNRIAKRLFDILFSALVLIVALPFVAIAILMIWFDAGRPIFYRQVRVGLEGEEFTLYKFRSMKEDPRVTRIGRILRRTSFDELPQFFNVLLGDMSVVGPRPERPEFVDHFKNYVPKYVERHRLKTGITGWAQVNGLRGEAPIAERTKYDLYYIENWSLGLDIRIIFKTIRAVVFGKDAY